MITSYVCTQCGSTDFIDIQKRKVRCAYCGSMYKVMTPEPILEISKGAHVIFGKNANIEVRGDIEVQNGANLEIQGKVTVLEGNKQQPFKLELIKDEGAEKKSNG